MRVPIRKSGKQSQVTPDPHVTQEKLTQLKKRFSELTKAAQPQAISEVKRLAELGDFSENAAYALAKGRLRRINQEIIELQKMLKRAVTIDPPSSLDTVQIGHRVTVLLSNEQKTFLILGSAETNPSKGIISHTSPIGTALMGRRIGEKFTIHGPQHQSHGEVVKIE